jgi:Protein of unknown function (DUF2905).
MVLFMSEFSGIGKLLMIFGAIMLIVGAIIWLGGKIPGFGRLPGDIVVKRGNFSFYFPIVTCIVISIVLSLIFSLFGRK